MISEAHYNEVLNSNQLLKEVVESLQRINTDLQLQHQKNQLQILQLQRLIFGSKSERFKSAQQAVELPTLFDLPPIAEEVVVSTQQVSYERKQKENRVNHPGRNATKTRHFTHHIPSLYTLA